MFLLKLEIYINLDLNKLFEDIKEISSLLLKVYKIIKNL